MKTFRILAIAILIGAGLAGSAHAESAIYTRTDMSNLLQRDATYEQNLRYLASADTAITPARVLRWMSGLMGHRVIARPSDFEFQPVLRVHDSQKQIVAQLAYKF
jgi:hypothetical protein